MGYKPVPLWEGAVGSCGHFAMVGVSEILRVFIRTFLAGWGST